MFGHRGARTLQNPAHPSQRIVAHHRPPGLRWCQPWLTLVPSPTSGISLTPVKKCTSIWEKLCGARLTNTFTRIGGLYRDAYPGFEDDVRAVLPKIENGVAEVRRLIEHNKIFVDRTQDVGAVSAEQAIAWGWTGPCLRASGVDLRSA